MRYNYRSHFCRNVFIVNTLHNTREIEHNALDDSATRTRRIKQQARELGFDRIGIAPALPLDEERAHLAAWLARGYHGDMRWMAADQEAIDRRTDPRRLLASAQSVVVVALNYFTDHEHRTEESHGKISRYAWGDDYHDVIGERLRLLLAWIKEQWAEAEGKICCDIQPMMDKAWAVRAGLGWLGKHSNLITRSHGSWVFIGELLLNLELDHDAHIEPDHCGSCTLCIEACPTNAIIAERVVDARRCISYSTIEHRGDELPAPVADNQAGWLYGCDICQDVCPWNRFEQLTEETRFAPRDDETSIELARILAWSPEDYAARFRKSAIKRAKLVGLQRNARALMKNQKVVEEQE